MKTSVSFVKIDVEGGELRVVDGMRGMLESNKRITIMMEFPQGPGDHGKPRAFLEHMRRQGFGIHHVDGGSVRPLADIGGLLSRHEGGAGGTNLIFVRG